MPTPEQIEDVRDRAFESINKGQTNWPGMSYEQGVEATIRWMLDETDEDPMEE